MKAKLFAIVPMIVLLFLGAYFIVQAHSDSTSPHPIFLHLDELVDNIGVDREVCEGQLEAVREDGKVNWVVDCKDARLRLVRTSSLVGQPRSGYAAYADLASPRRMLYYSLWVYPEPSEATKAMLRWKEQSADKAAEYEVDKQPDGFLMTRKDECGMP